MKQRDLSHCWEAGPTTNDGCSTTCVEQAGHQGPHQFIRDDEIIVAFVTDEPEELS